MANTLAAVCAGATSVQGTVNGIGERVGNTDLLTVIADLELKMDARCVGGHSLTQLTSVAQYVAELCNVSVPAHHPYTGSSAFAHKGGLHASAIARFPAAYEHVSPAAVGNASRTVVSELAGKASLLAKAKNLGFDLAAAGVDVQAVLDDIKAREAAGFTYEVADGSLGLLLMRHLGLYAPAFTLESFRVIVDDREDTGALAKDALSEATVKIHVGEGRFVATGESAGPVGALDAALRMAILESYPQVAAMELTDYKVRLLDESQGTDAITRVTITATDGVDTWGTVGVSENVIEASWNALVDSLEYGLFRARVRASRGKASPKTDASRSSFEGWMQYVSSSRNRGKNISLHDCRATHIRLSDDEITFVFPDGFWVWGDHDEIHLDDMVRTDTAEVTVKLCGNGAEDVYPYVFTSIGIDKDVRVFYDAERLVKEVNEGNWQLELLYRYDGGRILSDSIAFFGL